MNRTNIAVLSACAAICLAGCGVMGRPDPTTVTKVNSTDETTTSQEEAVVTAKADTDSQAEENTEEDAIPYSPETETDKYVEAVMEKMTLDEKVGQMFFVRVDALESGFEDKVINDDTIGGVTYVDDMMSDTLAEYHIGGVALFEKNIIDEDQLRTLTVELQDKSELPLFIGVNELGGSYAPIANNKNFDVELFEDMNVIGSTGSEEQAKTLGSAIGKYLVSYGVNIDFAPCADISIDPYNVSDSNFAGNSYIVAHMVSAEIDGLHDGGVMTAVNHFPGYADGNADGDQLYYNGSLWEYMQEFELLPFNEVLDKTDMVMVGHVDMPAVITDGMPASMSEELIQGRLRDELGYEGVIITDSMSVNSITSNFAERDVAVNAISAGADIVLMPYDLATSYNAVVDAVEKGSISEDRINESVKRILTLKAKNGLFTKPSAE